MPISVQSLSPHKSQEMGSSLYAKDDELTMNMWYLNNNRIFSTVKNKIMMCAGKWKKLENVRLKEVTQFRKTNFSLICELSLKFLDFCIWRVVPIGARKLERAIVGEGYSIWLSPVQALSIVLFISRLSIFKHCCQWHYSICSVLNYHDNFTVRLFVFYFHPNPE